MMAAIGTAALDHPELKSPDITLPWTTDYGFRSGFGGPPHCHCPERADAELVPEIVFATDLLTGAGATEPWIAVKRRRYVDHARCKAPIQIAPGSRRIALTCG
jgi:hypothetical protein